MDFDKYIFGEGYMPSWHCINNDQLIGWLTIIASLSIFVGYMLIGWFKYINLKDLAPSPGKSAMTYMVFIFAFCSLTYVFNVIMLYIPLWWIRLVFLIALSTFTWLYVFNMHKFKIVYREIADTGKLTKELHESMQLTQDFKNATKELTAPVNELSDTVIFGVDEDTKPQTVEQINKIRLKIEEMTKTLKKLEDLSEKT